MSDRTIGVGVLGTGFARTTQIPCLQATPGYEVVGLMSRNMTRAYDLAKEFGLRRTFDDVDKLLAVPEIELVVVSTPPHLHLPHSVAALRAGKHVLCEKPLAITVEEVDAIAAAALEARVVVAEGLMYRHHALTREVKALVERGTLGELRVIRGCFTFPFTREVDVRLDPALGGGCLWDLGVYPISYARLMAGAEPVEAFGWQTRGPTGVDVSFVGQLRFPGDVVLQCDTSFQAAFRRDVEMIGSEAALYVPNPFKPGRTEPVLLVRGDERQTIEIGGSDGHLYLGEVEDLADAVRLGRKPAIGLADSRGTVAAVVALLASAREGRPVKVG